MNNVFRYSPVLVKIIKEHLDDQEWEYDFNKKNGVFKFNLHLEGLLQHIQFVILVHENDCTVTALMPIGGDPENRKMMSQIAEFTCLVNFGLRQGCFEFDMTDGELRCRSYIDGIDCIPSKQVVEHCIRHISTLVECWGPGYCDVIFGGYDAVEAKEKCEQYLHQLLDNLLDEIEDDDSDSDEIFDD